MPVIFFEIDSPVLEFKVLKVVEIGLHTQFIGEIKDIKADESILAENGLPDIAKLQPFIYNTVGPLTYIHIRQNNGHLPMKFRLTAYPPSDNYRNIGHNICISYISPTHHNF